MLGEKSAGLSIGKCCVSDFPNVKQPVLVSLLSLFSAAAALPACSPALQHSSD